MFLVREFLKNFVPSQGRIRIGFILDVFPAPYSMIMASARIRAYDVIQHFSQDTTYLLELYRPWQRYDIVIFQKAFRKIHREQATSLRARGTTVVLDININVFDKDALSPYSGTTFYDDIQAFSQIAEYIIVSSEYLLAAGKTALPNHSITLIEEHIPNKLFAEKKVVASPPTTLLFAGYAVKAHEIRLIEETLKEIHVSHSFQILFLCEKDPKIQLSGIPCFFQKYTESRIRKQLLQGDIFIAPRNTDILYNKSHSFTKIGLPMAVGLPVIASPVPSYLHSPAIICRTPDEWKKALTNLFTDTALRMELSEQGRRYCLKNFSTKTIMDRYRDFFDSISERGSVKP